MRWRRRVSEAEVAKSEIHSYSYMYMYILYTCICNINVYTKIESTNSCLKILRNGEKIQSKIYCTCKYIRIDKLRI
jgi:hypothetical protein